MGGSAQGASRVRYVCRRMYVCHLHRGPKNQQQSAAQGKHERPAVPSVTFGLHIVHSSNYNVPLSRQSVTTDRQPVERPLIQTTLGTFR